MNGGVLGENAGKKTLQKRSQDNKNERSSAQKVEIINIEDLDVVSPLKKRYKTKRLITPCKIIIRSTERLSNDSRSQQRSKIST